jgi:hypothetical protein
MLSMLIVIIAPEVDNLTPFTICYKDTTYLIIRQVNIYIFWKKKHDHGLVEL